jgi:hypothetical protein
MDAPVSGAFVVSGRENQRMAVETTPEAKPFSDELEGWLQGDQPKTIGSLVELFGEKSFAVLFLLLLAIPALPLPTGGVTHVFEVIAILLALELIAGRREVWLPKRWCRRELGPGAEKRTQVLIKRIRWLERHSRPRFGFLLSYRVSRAAFGAVVLVFSLGAFLAPPFTGLDTLPSLGVVIISLGVLLEDVRLGIAGTLIGTLGIVLAIVLGKAAVHEVGKLF